MTKKPATQNYAADMDVTSTGNTDDDAMDLVNEVLAEEAASEEAASEEAASEEAASEEEVFISASTRAEMEGGRAALAKAAASAAAE